MNVCFPSATIPFYGFLCFFGSPVPNDPNDFCQKRGFLYHFLTDPKTAPFSLGKIADLRLQAVKAVFRKKSRKILRHFKNYEKLFLMIQMIQIFI